MACTRPNRPTMLTNICDRPEYPAASSIRLARSASAASRLSRRMTSSGSKTRNFSSGAAKPVTSGRSDASKCSALVDDARVQAWISLCGKLADGKPDWACVAAAAKAKSALD